MTVAQGLVSIYFDGDVNQKGEFVAKGYKGKLLEEVKSLFSDYSASPVREMKTLSGKLAWEVEAYINGVKVQFFGGDENDIYSGKMAARMTTKVSIDGIKVPCLTLEAEMKSYIETNREHKAKIIKDFLNTRSVKI